LQGSLIPSNITEAVITPVFAMADFQIRRLPGLITTVVIVPIGLENSILLSAEKIIRMSISVSTRRRWNNDGRADEMHANFVDARHVPFMKYDCGQVLDFIEYAVTTLM
jgi:hypothetical protein